MVGVVFKCDKQKDRYTIEKTQDEKRCSVLKINNKKSSQKQSACRPLHSSSMSSANWKASKFFGFFCS